MPFEPDAFAERLAKIRDHKLGIAREVAREYVQRDNVDAVFLTGSLLADLGSSYSDIDLFVIQHEDRPRRPRQIKRDGERVDVEFRSLDWLGSLAEEISFDASIENPWSVVRSKVPYDLTVRVLLSEVVKRSAAYDDTVSRLRERETDLRKLIVGRYAQMAIGNLEDCLGFLVDGDLPSALIVSHELLLNALQSFTAGCGDLYLGQKWVLRKIARCGGPAFPQDILDQLLHGGGSDTCVVENRLRFAQSLICAALLNGWDEPEAETWNEWGLGDGPLLRSLEWLPVRLTDGIVLSHRAQRTLQITPRVLKLWSQVDGSRDREQMLRLAAEEGLRDDETTAMLDILTAKGVLLADRA